MSTISNERLPPERRRSPWARVHLGWAAFVVVSYAAVVAMAAATPHPEGRCSGIGWGCTLSGTDLAAILAVLLAPVALLLLVAGHAAIAIARWWVRRRGRDENAAV